MIPSTAHRLRRCSFFLLAAAGVVFMAYVDLTARARAAYRRAELMERWLQFPAERDQAMEGDFLKGVAALDRARPSTVERDLALEVLRKKREEARNRPAAADAYHAWRDVYELYGPPETFRTRRARLMAPADRQRWREDWTARRLPFEESLLDLEKGEDGGYRWVYSTADGREASQALNRFQALDIPAKLVPPDPRRSAGDPSIKLLVPEDRFWEAHEALRAFAEK